MGGSTLFLASVASTLGGLVFGYELGIISGALLQLKAEFGLSCIQQEFLVSALLIGALLASVVGAASRLIDRSGRRNSILLSNLLILAGSLILLVSSYPAQVLGRITVGSAMCISSMSCCIFVSELVSPHRRGSLVTLYEAGITVGILAAYAINYILSGTSSGWKWMFGLAVVPTLLQLAAIRFLPSNSEECVSREDRTQPERDLRSQNQEQDDSEVQSTEQYTFKYLFHHKDNMRTRTVIGLALVTFQQLTGQPNLLLYASTIFHSVGFHSQASAVLASVGVGVIKVVTTLISMVISDRVGRRPLLIGGCVVMALGLMTIGLLSGRLFSEASRPCVSKDFMNNATSLPHVPAHNQSVFDSLGARPLETQGTVEHWVILLCMLAVVAAYSVGFGPMTWLVLSEIFPAAVRGQAFAFASCFNWAANLLVTCTFLNVIDWIGLSGTFLFYGINAVAAGLFFYFLLPETKGKSLEEIDEELRLNRFYRSEECCSFINRPSASVQYHRVQGQQSAD
ncbi:solute carrier family 2, facilitated glucose transporter member 10 [Genypterus blacodes]|uniref:solute carrier family 2, facilitated glucose transporter member 10 n=1 Tax=Genypterus blacodes TaxID=154954 RepID=UPI003F7632F7